MNEVAAENSVPVVTYSVPRRFGMGTLLIASTLMGIVAGVGNWLQAQPLEIAIWALFFVLVALAQMVGERLPRAASALVGMLAATLLLINPFQLETLPAIQHPFQAASFIIFGGLLGYVVGTLLAAVYLLHDLSQACLLRLALAQRRSIT